MENIKEYIVNGKGYGFKFLAILALIMAMVFANDVKDAGEFIIPQLQTAADNLFPLKIENGTLVEPADTVKTYQVNFAPGIGLDVELNTTVDTLNVADLKQGIYLTRKNIYVVSDRQTKISPFTGNNYFPAGDYQDMLRDAVVWTAIAGAVVMLLVYFIKYICFAAILALISYPLAKAFNRSLNSGIAMRLGVCSVIITEIACWLLEFLNIGGYWLPLLIALLAETLLLKSITQNYNLPQNNQVEKI